MLVVRRALVGLLLLLASCSGGSDNTVGTVDEVLESEPTAIPTVSPTETPTPDPLDAQRQASLDGVLVNYPGVRGVLVGSVVVLDGTVENDMERAEVDEAVRGAGLAVQNNVVASQQGFAGYSLLQVIQAQPELSTLAELLDQAGLGDALDGGDDLTIFAPTNDALATISDQLEEVQDDPTAVRDLLLYHLLDGTQDAAALLESGTVGTQLEGESLAVQESRPYLELNGSVPLLVEDVMARNGVVHIVGQVLIPESLPVFAEEIGARLSLGPVNFDAGTANLTDDSTIEIDKVVEYLLRKPQTIQIGGHTDSDGSASTNRVLSQARADAVRDYMVAQDIPAESLTTAGFGEDEPIAPNDTDENKAKNRRIEFRPIR